MAPNYKLQLKSGLLEQQNRNDVYGRYSNLISACDMNVRPDSDQWPIQMGLIQDVSIEQHTCEVYTDSGMDLKDVSWISPWFSCSTAGGMYIMPEAHARVMVGKVDNGDWYILGFTPLPGREESYATVNGRRNIQQGDIVLNTAYGNFIELRKHGESITIQNNETSAIIMNAAEDLTFVKSRKLKILNSAGTIDMTSEPASKGGRTRTTAYFRRKIDDDKNFVKVIIGSMADVSGLPNHKALPVNGEDNDVIFYLNVCDKFKLSIDISGNVKLNGHAWNNEFLKFVRTLSADTIYDEAVVDIIHSKASAGGIASDLGGSQGVENAEYKVPPTPSAPNVVAGPPNSMFSVDRTQIGMGGNGNTGGNGGYQGDDAPGGFQPSPAYTPDVPNETLTGADKLIDHTALNEGGGKYDAWTANDNGHGVSFGLIQFNQEMGSLPSLMKSMHDANPTKFDQIMGPHATNMTNADWVRSANLNDPDIKSRMQQLGRDDEFKAVQRQYAKNNYFNPADKAAQKYGLTSEKSRAMLFDTAVQYGPGGMNRFVKQAAAKGGTEQEILTRVAEMADTHKYDNNRRHAVLNDPNLSWNTYTP